MKKRLPPKSFSMSGCLKEFVFIAYRFKKIERKISPLGIGLYPLHAGNFSCCKNRRELYRVKILLLQPVLPSTEQAK
jgi:hypothetical protein